MKSKRKIYTVKFCRLVAAQMKNLKASSVKTQLYQRGFLKNNCKGRKVEGGYNRPYFTADQVPEAVRLLKGE